MHKILISFFAALSLLSWSSLTSAIPMTWYIDDLLFEDGGLVTGAFDYDADTGIFSNISIVTTAGTVRGGASYTNGTGLGNQNYADFLEPGILVVPLTTNRFDLFLAGPMTNAGGVILIAQADEFTCLSTSCSYSTGTEAGLDLRRLVSGQSISTIANVPVPATIMLFGIGFLCLAWSRRKTA